jgi:hypothetical protein
MKHLADMNETERSEYLKAFREEYAKRRAERILLLDDVIARLTKYRHELGNVEVYIQYEDCDRNVTLAVEEIGIGWFGRFVVIS